MTSANTPKEVHTNSSIASELIATAAVDVSYHESGLHRKEVATSHEQRIWFLLIFHDVTEFHSFIHYSP